MMSTVKSSACILLLAGVVVVMAEDFNCDSYNPNVCQTDAIMFCLTNGSIITGRCHAQRAVCREQAALDITFAACSHGKTVNFDCDQYKANPTLCTKDLIPYCLNNGTIVRGSCRAKRAVCMEGRQIEDDFEACNNAATGTRTNDRDNSAVTTPVTISLVLAMLLLFLSALI